MTQTTGHYARIEGAPVVRFERTFPHPVDAVWEAISDPRQLERWFPTTVQFESLTAGAAIEFHFEEDRYPAMTGEVLEVRPPRCLAFTWGDDRLTFELEPREQGAACRLAFSVVLDSEDKAARDSAGWESCLDRLEQVTAGEAVQGLADPGSWDAYYQEYKRQGLPATAEIPQ